MKILLKLTGFLTFLVLLLIPSPPLDIKARDENPVVVISPGHGWWDPGSAQVDPGASLGDLVEKDINLDIAQFTDEYLSRCPVEVYLTRDGDDPDHTLADVDEIVNGYHPNLAISIHTNSGNGNPSGTEGWYTVDGYDDARSQRLAASMADHIHDRLEITDRGAKPETSNRHGGLYIHWWEAPAALVEVAFLQGDAELLRSQRDDFGRAIAQAILEDLDLEPGCADWAVAEGVQVSTYFPGERKVNQVSLRNDGLVDWTRANYSLSNMNNPYGAETQYPLPQEVEVGRTAAWQIPSLAPSTPGVYHQTWQLMRGDKPIREKSSVYIIVVPEEARQLKDEIEEQVEQFKRQGEQQIEDLIQQLEQDAVNWVTQELPNIICPQLGIVIGFAAGVVLITRKRRADP